MELIELDRVGADIEVFLVNAAGAPVPCIDIVKGSKAHPAPLIPVDGYTVQPDNAALEYGIPPSSDVHAFVYSIMRAQEAVTEQVRNYGLAPAVVASMKFTEESLKHKQTQTAGCEPDYGAWERVVNDPVKLDKEWRAAGGHIHTSFTIGKKQPEFPANLAEVEMLTKTYDIAIGAMSIFLDKDTVRRQFYGKAGAFRPKPYGFEYRTCSNFWTKEPKLVAWIYHQVQWAIKQANYYIQYKPTGSDSLDRYKDLVMKAINNSDRASAESLRQAFRLQLP